jgi:magnesium chelatase family protein
VSGPLLDRIDLHIDVPSVPFDVMTKAPEGESSATIRAHVQRAIAFRRKRGQHQPNAQLRTKELKTICELAPPTLALLKSAMQELNLSARSYTKILKIARTIADLAQQETIQPEHVAEAIQYRSLDRQLWT